METDLAIIGTVVAVVASGLGVIAAVEQLTLRARLRRTAELTTVLTEAEENLQRRKALRSVHDVAVARLAAGWIVPWWRFLVFAAVVIACSANVGWLLAVNGWDAASAVFTVGSAIATWLFSRGGVRLYLERQRVARDYLRGAEITLPRVGPSDLHGHDAAFEFTVGAAFGFGTMMTCVGVGVLIHDFDTTWAAPLVGVGPLLAVASFVWLHDKGVRPLEVESLPSPDVT